VNFKKALSWVAIVFVVYYLATQPAGAAHFVHSVFGWLQGPGTRCRRSSTTFSQPQAAPPLR
jgi:hypothetical protein